MNTKIKISLTPNHDKAIKINMKYIIALCIILIVGCKSNHMFRRDTEECKKPQKNNCAESCIIRSDCTDYPYTLSFVEIDDQGHFQSRAQLNKVIKFIKSQDHQDIVIFIHGWHCNAQPDDKSLKNFEKMLKSISQRYETQNEKIKRKINGIFVGWRGESIPVKLINIATFWDRKDVSIEVGAGSLIELLVRLENIAKNNNKCRLISIGHSFGASVLFSATKNILYQNFINSFESNEISGFGDLVILINPAFEAIPYAPLRDITEEYAREYAKKLNTATIFKKPMKPKLLILTSESDYATRLFFKIGRFFSSTLFENHNEIKRIDRNGNIQKFSQRSMNINAIGHYKPFQTHTLKSVDPIQLTSCNAMPAKWDDMIEYDDTSDKTSKEGWSILFPASKLRLRHIKNSPAFSPYWVVVVDKNVIPGHNEIYQVNLNCFIEELLLAR
jgi:hypothetical protein